IVAALRQREASDAAIFRSEAVVVVAGHQSVVGIELIIEPRTKIDAAPWHHNPKARVKRIQTGIQLPDGDQFIVISLAPFEVNKKRSLLCYERSAQVAAVAAHLI